MKKFLENVWGFILVFTFIIPIIPIIAILSVAYGIELFRYHAFLQMMGWNEQRVGFWHWLFLFGGMHK